MEKCANCEKNIGNLEPACGYMGKIVCSECYKILNPAKNSTTGTRTGKFFRRVIFVILFVLIVAIYLFIYDISESIPNYSISESTSKADTFSPSYSVNALKFTKPLHIGTTAYLGREQSIEVLQIIDDTNMIANLVITPESTQTVWVRGYDTSSLVDGVVIDREQIPFKYAFHVSGTKRYTTILGSSSTIFILEFVKCRF